VRSVRAGVLAAALGLAHAGAAQAGGGPFGIDHVVPYDNSGIWARSVQKDLAAATALTAIGGALWLGDDDKLGDTLWRSVDAMAMTAVTTQAMKFTFSRERPSQTSDPNRFFTGHGNQSFPSGEVAEIAGAVTPVMITYGHDHPWVYGLAALPVYDAIARVKVHGHWQSDVIVGAAVGVGFGIYASRRPTPFIVGILPHGLTIGFSKRF
jgi:PAP2 superfamily